MGGVKIDKLGGMLPAWDNRFIPEDQASFCRNTYLYSGACIGWRTPKLLRNLTNSAAKMAYRIPAITQAIANANLIFKQNAQQNDTVTLGEITYKFTASVVNPFDVLLGSSAIQSSQNLFEAINFGSQDVTVVGNNTQINPAAAPQNPYIGFPFSVVGSLVTPGANTIILMPVTPTGSMILNSVNLVAGATNGAAKFKGVIYDNVNALNAAGTAYINTPTTLIATATEVVGCTKDTTLTSNFAIPVTLQAGFTYWIGFILDSAVSLHLASLGTIGVSNANTYSSGPPNPFVTTNISGATTGGTSVGTGQAAFNTSQPNWQIWGATSLISSTDAQNTIGIYDFGSGPLPYIQVQAPAFGTSYNQTPVAESTGNTRLKWNAGFAPIATAPVTFMSGGANQTSDTTMTGASLWLEFLDQDTDVLRTPVVDDTFQRYYFASPSVPPQYNTLDRISQGKPAFYLGVPAPPIAPTLTITGGGTPTQIGFPNSNTASLQNIPAGPAFVVLYPVTTTVPVTLNDISFSLAQIPSGTGVGFVGVVFNSNTAGNAGDILATGNIATPTGPLTSPQTITSTLSVPPVLLPNTKYWIGVQILGIAIIGGGNPIPSGIQFSLADTTGNQGFTGTLPTGTFPIDPTTGAQEAPTMTAGYPDLQLWGDLSPANQVISTSIGIQETRAYVYTWVTAYGEEGPPSPPALLTGFNNATWQVGLQQPLTKDMGTLRNIVKTNIYRTMASVQGGTVFFLVDSISAQSTSYNDSFTDDVVAGNLILPSTNWFGPPATLQSLVAMPNGMMAGFVGNEVWFCEPYRPHAWPPTYVVTTDYPIIGLGVVGNTLVAATTFNPQTFTGVNPANVTQARIPLPEPCISRRSVLSTDSGVYYASANGLIKVQAAGIASNMTQNWITRDQWDKLTPQKFVRAVKNVSAYFAFGSTGPGIGPSTSASIVVTFTGQPANFDVLAVLSPAEINYVMLTDLTLSTAPTRVLIGSTIAQTVSNLAAAINDSGVSGTNYSSDVSQNPGISAVASGNNLILTARIAGPSGNNFEVAGTTIPISLPNGQHSGVLYFAFLTGGANAGPTTDTSVAQQGFTLELSEVADRGSFSLWPQVGGHRIGFSSLNSPIGLNIDNVLSDPWSGVTFLVAGGGIYYYDFTDQLPTITPYLWRSKKFQGPHKENFAAFRVWFDIPPGGPQSPPLNRTTVPFQEHPQTQAQMIFVPGMFGIVRIIADGLYITERELRTSEELMRVASAQKYTTWQMEIEGVVSVTNMKMATTVKELGQMK